VITAARERTYLFVDSSLLIANDVKALVRSVSDQSYTEAPLARSPCTIMVDVYSMHTFTVNIITD